MESEMHIGSIESNLNITDSKSLLTPQLLAQITQVVLASMRDQEAYEGRVGNEQSIAARSSAAHDDIG